MSSDQPPWLTVVTLHKDDPTGLTATIASVAEQNLEGVQHMLVESGDTRPPEHGPTWTRIWVPARGIYPSMNAALPHVSGVYVLFLNAGDTLHDSTVLDSVRHLLDRDEPAWAYGSVVLVPRAGDPRPQPAFDYASERRARFSRGRFPMQPAIVTRTSILRGLGGFDETYTIAADYKVMLKLASREAPLLLNREITDFRLGGASSARWVDSLAEARRARTEVLPPSPIERIRDGGHTAVAHLRAAASRVLGRV